LFVRAAVIQNLTTATPDQRKELLDKYSTLNEGTEVFLKGRVRDALFALSPTPNQLAELKDKNINVKGQAAQRFKAGTSATRDELEKLGDLCEVQDIAALSNILPDPVPPNWPGANWVLGKAAGMLTANVPDVLDDGLKRLAERLGPGSPLISELSTIAGCSTDPLQRWNMLQPLARAEAAPSGLTRKKIESQLAQSGFQLKNPNAAVELNQEGTEANLSATSPSTHFLLVQSGTSDPFYLATTEFSIRQFREVVRSRAFRPANPASSCLKLWQYSAGAVRSQGVKRFDSTGVSPTLVSALPRWVSATAPNDAAVDDLPLQHISFNDAKAIAAMTGCRLPTSPEWTAAVARAGNARQSGASLQTSVRFLDAINKLRGAEFVKVYSTPAGWKDTLEPLLPSLNSYSPPLDAQKNLKIEIIGTREPAVPYDYFRPVPQGSTSFVDLIGNVAEWAEDPQPAIIGGSTFSDPDTAETAVPPGTTRTFPDVGFRLALSAVKSPGAKPIGLAQSDDLTLLRSQLWQERRSALLQPAPKH
jgi:formylglycine-generating enzyme required for sulfatase activity